MNIVFKNKVLRKMFGT